MIEGRHQQHSTYSASSSHRWSPPNGCPASAIMTKLAPPKPSSPAAAEGTQAHELLEKTFKGEPINSADYPAKAHEGVKIAVDFAESLIGSDTHIFVEEKWTWRLVDWLPYEDEIYGYADAVIYDPADGRLDVIDYKHGVHYIKAAENNRQLMQYAVSVAQHIDFIGEIHVHIVQPFGFDGISVKSWQVSPEALAKYAREVEAAIELNGIYHLTGSLEGLTFRPSPNNCHWCAGFASCGAAQKAALKGQWSDAPEPPEMAAALAHADYMEAWIKETRSLGLSMAMDGIDLPGLKLVAKETRRRFIADPKEVCNKLWELGRVSPAEVMPPELVSPAQAEKLLKEKLAGRGAKPKEIKKAIEDIAFLMGKPESSGFDLVPVTDRRPAANPRVKLFGEIKLPATKET